MAENKDKEEFDEKEKEKLHKKKTTEPEQTGCYFFIYAGVISRAQP